MMWAILVYFVIIGFMYFGSLIAEENQDPYKKFRKDVEKTKTIKEARDLIDILYTREKANPGKLNREWALLEKRIEYFKNLEK